MNFLDLCKSLRMECSVAGVGPDHVTNQTGTYAKLVNWIQVANTEIQGRYFNWKFLFSHFVHTEESLRREFAEDVNARRINPPDDLNVWVLDSFTLNGERIPAMEYHDRAVADDRFSKQPFVVVNPDNSLMVRNFDNGFPAIEADYYRKPQELMADDDEPLFPSQYHYLIVYRAMMMYGGYDNAPEITASGAEGFQLMLPTLEANQLPLHSETLMPNQQDLVIRCE